MSYQHQVAHGPGHGGDVDEKRRFSLEGKRPFLLGPLIKLVFYIFRRKRDRFG